MLLPEAISERPFEVFTPNLSLEEFNVSLGIFATLGVNERDVEELIRERSQKRTTEEYHSQQHMEVLQEFFSVRSKSRKKLSLKVR